MYSKNVQAFAPLSVRVLFVLSVHASCRWLLWGHGKNIPFNSTAASDLEQESINF